MSPASRFSPTDSFLGVLILAATAQFTNAAIWSLCGALGSSWIGSLLIILVAFPAFGMVWKNSHSEARRSISSAWTWPLPWVFLAVILWQTVAFPPTMNDSLCYRLPRIFLWLQDGYISQTGGADGRMREMPWGWEILALPLVAINQVNLVGLVNLAAWVIVFQLTFCWATTAGASLKNARWLSLGIATAPVFLLQASSSANDLFAAAALMVSVHFIISFAGDPKPARIHLSLIAFMMACGVKPQFLVLGLGWGLWWIFGKGKPWKHTGIAALTVAGPFALLVSPLPVFILNYLDSGTFIGGEISAAVGGNNSPGLNIIAASVLFLFSQLQLPLVPGADKINLVIQSFGPFQTIKNQIPDFSPSFGLIQIIDQASLGLMHFALIGIGIVFSVRSKNYLYRCILIIAVIGFSIAGAKVVPETIGRSFVGFVAILIPLTAWGLAKVRTAWLRPACILAILAGGASLILNPSSPAWPSRSLEKYAVSSGKTGLAEKLGRYHAYQERAQTGVGFLAPVPAGQPVAALVRSFTPIVGLFTPDWRRNRIDFVQNIEARKFNRGSHRWLLIGDNSGEFYPEQEQAYRRLPGWKIISEKEFRPTLSQGVEKWTLYKRANN